MEDQWFLSPIQGKPLQSGTGLIENNGDKELLSPNQHNKICLFLLQVSKNTIELDTGLAESYATDFTLIIPAVQLQDSGKYTCLGEILQTVVNASVTLRVLGR